MFPVTVIDNFFPHPDKIVDLVKDVPFLKNDVGNYPGVRSDLLEKTKPELSYYIATKLLSMFYPPELGIPMSWDATIELQKVTPFTPNDPYNKKNRGWIHRDTIKHMTAIIYLDKNPIQIQAQMFMSLIMELVCMVLINLKILRVLKNVII